MSAQDRKTYTLTPERYCSAYCIGHHGEILQGVFHTEGGKPVRALVTMPFHGGGTTAFAQLTTEDGIRVFPAGRWKAFRAAELTRKALRIKAGLRITLSSDLPPGLGMGSSTADVVSTIHAIAGAAGRQLSESRVAGLAVQAEKAADSLMFQSKVVLFAQREGRVIEALGSRLPSMIVVGCCCDDGTVETLDQALIEYTPADQRDFEQLRSRIRAAVRDDDASALASVATDSALINQRYIPKRRFSEFMGVAQRGGALGVQISHSGTVAGMIFDGRDPESVERAALARRMLSLRALEPNWSFRTDERFPPLSLRQGKYRDA